jgi:outer membrane protein assembly factor BamB
MRTVRIAAIPAVVMLMAWGSLQAVPASAPGGNWPQWRGPLRDGVSTETGLLSSWPASGPPLVWSAKGLGRGFSSISVAGGKIFTMGDRGNAQFVIALDEETGKELWAARIGANYSSPDDFNGPRGTPTIDDGVAYALGTYSDLVAVDIATGKERWRRNLERDFGGQMMSGWQWSESPLVDGDRVVVTPGTSRTALVTLDKLTGKEIWRAGVPRLGPKGADGAGYSSIVISNGGGVKQYVQLTGRGLLGVRASDGRYLWGNNAVANDIANISTPIVKGNVVFASTSYDTGSVMVELTADEHGGVTATQKYFIPPNRFQSHHGGMVLVGDYLYGGHGQSNGFPVCLDLATGKSMWSPVRNAGTGSAAVIAADGKLYFRYQNGMVVLIDATPAGYKESGSFQIPNPFHLSWPHPVIAGGRLYLREQDALHAYNIKR